MNQLHRIGRALMVPVAVLPLCGLLMGVGYLIAPATMGVPGAPSQGAAYVAGLVMVRAGGALMDNLAWLFAVGAAAGLSHEHKGASALAALASMLVITQLLSPTVVASAQGLVGQAYSDWAASVQGLAFARLGASPLLGILAAVLGSACCDAAADKRLPGALGFLSGATLGVALSALASLVAALLLLVAWPALYEGVAALGQALAGLGGPGAAIYAFLNRLLMPTGLHHALNGALWSDATGLGDLTRFWAQDTSDNVSWSLGMYMSGFFPCMMFGVPGAALALSRESGDKKAAAGFFAAAALCAFVGGVTEPFEFAFLFLCPLLYVAYAALYGVFALATYYVGFRAGFCLNAGAADLYLSSGLPAAQGAWLIVPLGITAFVCFYLVFRYCARRVGLDVFPAGEKGGEKDGAVGAREKSEAAGTARDPEAPGRRATGRAPEGGKPAAASSGRARTAQALLVALGGKANLKAADFCATRLRFKVADVAKVNEGACRAAGARGFSKDDAGEVRLVMGPGAPEVYEALVRLLG